MNILALDIDSIDFLFIVACTHVWPDKNSAVDLIILGGIKAIDKLLQAPAPVKSRSSFGLCPLYTDSPPPP